LAILIKLISANIPYKFQVQLCYSVSL